MPPIVIEVFHNRIRNNNVHLFHVDDENIIYAEVLERFRAELETQCTFTPPRHTGSGHPDSLTDGDGWV